MPPPVQPGSLTLEEAMKPVFKKRALTLEEAYPKPEYGKPTLFNPEPGFTAAKEWGAKVTAIGDKLSEAIVTPDAQGKEKSALDVADNLVVGGVKALASGVRSLGETAVAGASALTAAGAAMVPGGKAPGAAFSEEYEFQQAENEKQRQVLQALTGINLAPVNKEEEAMHQLLMLIPEGLHAIGETVYERTGVAVLAAGTEAAATLLAIKPDAAARMMQGIKSKPKPGRAPGAEFDFGEPTPPGGGGGGGPVTTKGGPRAEPPLKSAGQSDISRKFDELAASNPKTAVAIADHVRKADPDLGARLDEAITAVSEATPEQLAKLGEASVSLDAERAEFLKRPGEREAVDKISQDNRERLLRGESDVPGVGTPSVVDRIVSTNADFMKFLDEKTPKDVKVELADKLFPTDKPPPTRNFGTVEDLVRQIKGEGPGQFDLEGFITRKMEKEERMSAVPKEHRGKFGSKVTELSPTIVKDGKPFTATIQLENRWVPSKKNFATREEADAYGKRMLSKLMDMVDRRRRRFGKPGGMGIKAALEKLEEAHAKTEVVLDEVGGKRLEKRMDKSGLTLTPNDVIPTYEVRPNAKGSYEVVLVTEKSTDKGKTLVKAKPDQVLATFVSKEGAEEYADKQFRALVKREGLEDFFPELSEPAIPPFLEGVSKVPMPRSMVKAGMEVVEGGKKSPERVPQVENVPAAYPTLPKELAKGEGVPIDRIAKLMAETQPKGDPLVPGKKRSDDMLPSKQQIKSKPGVNARRLATMMGPQLYGDPSKMAVATIKEVLQNSFDAIKAAFPDEGKGTVKIDTKEEARTITITDNGSGMTPELLGTKFLEIAGSGKETTTASGGFGIAKMLFLYGNKALEVTTYRDGKVAMMKTSGEQLFQALEDPSAAPVINVRPADHADRIIWPEGHGTQITLTIPESFKDPGSGETKPIEMIPSWYDSSSIIPLHRSPLFAPITVTLNTGLSMPETVPIGKHFPYDDFSQFVNVKFDWGAVRIYVSKQPRKKESNYDPNLHILSNGLWQFSGKLTKDFQQWGDLIPYDFYIDVAPSVKPDEPGYPFTFNRQGLVEQAKSDFKKVIDHINALYAFKDFSDSAKNFGTIQYIDRGSDGKVTVSEPKDLKPTKPAPKSKFDTIKQGDKVSVKDGKLLVNGVEQAPIDIKDLQKSRPDAGELILAKGEINPGWVMLHENVVFSKGSDKGEGSLIRVMQDLYPGRYDDYISTVGETFLELRNVVADIMGYDDLLQEGVGISFDKKYHGVSIRVPFSGSFINPLTPASENPVEMGFDMIGTMIHELAHHKVRQHDAEFPDEMQKILVRLNTAGYIPSGAERNKYLTELDVGSGSDMFFDFNAFQQKFVDAVIQYEDIIAAGKELFNGNDLEPRGVGFEPGGIEQRSRSGDAGDAQRDRDVEGRGGAGQPLLGGPAQGGQPVGPEGSGAEGIGNVPRPVDPQQAVMADGMAESMAQTLKSSDAPEPPPAGLEDPIVYMNMGIPITAAQVKSAFDFSKKHVPGVAFSAGKVAGYWNGLLRTFAPEAIGPQGKRAGGIIASHVARQGIEEHKVHGPAANQRRAFWNHRGITTADLAAKYEKGERFDDPLVQKAAEGYKAWSNIIYTAEQGLGLKYDAVENYLYHTFEDGPGLERHFKGKYGLRWGDPGFLKDRTFSLYEEAIKAGFKPRFSNPEDVMQARQHAHEIARTKIDMLRELEQNGLAVRKAKADKTPPRNLVNFSTTPRRSPNGDQYWVHEQASNILRNLYDTKSLWTAEGSGGDIFRGTMWLKNSITPVILSMSAFHGLHVLTIDNITGMVRATKELLSGVETPGGWLLRMGKSALFMDFFSNPKQGGRINSLIKGKIPEKDWTYSDKVAIQTMIEGGFVPLMAHHYKTGAIQQFTDALQKTVGSLKRGDIIGIDTTGARPKFRGVAPEGVTALWHLPFALTQLMQKPMFEIWIPNLKAASYLNDAATALKTDPTLLQDVGRRKEVLRKIAKSVDNRYGEMAYNTLFWTRWVKDIGVGSSLSLGWNLGFIREYGGAGIELGQLLTQHKPQQMEFSPRAPGGRIPPTGGGPGRAARGDMDKMMFTSLYTLVGAMMVGGLINWLMGEDEPDELLDYVMPKSGEKNPDGTDQRLNTMFYAREFLGISRHMEAEGVVGGLYDTVKNKASPALSMGWMWATGMNSFDQEIRDPNGTPYQKLQQTLLYTFYELEPISIATINQDPNRSAKTIALAVAGFSPAPKYITATATETAIRHTFQEYYGAKKTPFERAAYGDDAKRLKGYYNSNDMTKYTNLLTEMEEKYELSADESRRLTNSVQNAEDPLLKMFQRFPWKEQRRLLDKMTPEEREYFLPKANKDHLRYDYVPPELRQ